jgi:hypothetical protein
LLNKDDLKTWLHRKGIGRQDKLLLALATFDEPCGVRDIMKRCADAGLKVQTTWNPSSLLSRSKGLAIHLPAGWELSDSGKQHLRNLGVSKLSPAAVQVATDLRAYLAKITNDDVRDYVEEAIRCYEGELYKSAIVMSWLAAIAVLHAVVVKKHLVAFNAEMTRIDSKWKAAKNEDDLGKIKESDFLDRLAGISMIGKNPKETLKKVLDLRNACGHPTSLKVSTNTAAAHIEVLLLNVFNVFQI